MLPADRGLIFAETFLESFQEGTRRDLQDARERLHKVIQPKDNDRRLLPDVLTAAAGIAYVHSHYPARIAHDLSDDLCRFAKAPFRSKKRGERSALAFHRVTASAVDDYDEIIRRELTFSVSGRSSFRLTMGPYVVHPDGKGYVDRDLPTVAALHALHRLARQLPRGSWRELVTLCYESDTAARHRYQRLCEIAEKRGLGKIVEETRGVFISLGCNQDAFWGTRQVRDDETILVTPVPDVAALMAVEPAADRDGERRGDAA